MRKLFIIKFSKFVFSILTVVSTFVGHAMAESQDREESSIVELQWAICDQSASQVSQLLASSSSLRSQDKRGRLVYLDTVDRQLYRSKVQVKIEDVEGEFKVTVKVNRETDKGVQLRQGSGGLRLDTLKKVKCEWDQYLNYRKYACKMTNKLDQLTQNYFSPEQIEFILGETGVYLPSLKLAPLGGWYIYEKLDLFFSDKELEEATVDSLFSSVGPLTELSVRTQLASAMAIQAKVNGLIQSSQIKLCPQQKGKLARILQP